MRAHGLSCSLQSEAERETQREKGSSPLPLHPPLPVGRSALLIVP